ncbi:MAG: hypothetical protein ABI036_08635 [Fibrobacteria bacterium]
MSGRSPAPSQSPQSSPALSKQAKIRVMLPIALAVAVLSLFLVAFWPDSQHGKKSGAGREQSGRNPSPVGYSDRGPRKNSSNSEGTQGGYSPVGGDRSASHAGSKGGWWYHEEDKSRAKEKTWWWQDKHEERSEDKRSESSEDKTRASSSPAREPVEMTPGGWTPDEPDEKTASKATPPSNSGPDNNWWRD